MCPNINVTSEEPNEYVKEYHSIDEYFQHPSKVQYEQCLRSRGYTYCNIDWRCAKDRYCIVDMSPKVIDLLHNKGKRIICLLWRLAFNKEPTNYLRQRDGKTLR